MALDLKDLTASQGFVINGVQTGSILGVSPTYLGDVNGDGFDDFGVLAERAGSNWQGTAYIIFGRDGDFGASIDLNDLGDDAAQFIGPFERAQANRIGAAGDLNNDGYDDVVIGVSRDDTYLVNGSIEKYEGAAYVVFGGPDLAGTVDVLPAADGFVFEGNERSNINTPWNTGEELGYSVGDRGDFNGDGIDDLIVGSNGDDDTTGDAFVIYGRADGAFAAVLSPEDLDGTNGVRFRGVDTNDATGAATTLVDLNGDGVDDLVVGARAASVNGRNVSGAVYVVFGGQDFSGSEQLAESGGINDHAGLTLVGPWGMGVGWAVDHAGDVNGDGIADVIVSGPGSNGFAFPGDPGWNPPEAYVIFGRTDGFPDVIDLETLDGSDGFTIENIGVISYPHSFVSGVGDFNGDGFDDLVIGADDTNGYKGQVTLIYGRGDYSETPVIDAESVDGTTAGLRLTNDSTVGELGNGVKGAGDINNDGIADLLIGSNWSDISGQDAGQMWGLYGFHILVPPTAITLTSENVDAGPVTVDVTLALTRAGLNPITLAYETVDGTALAGEDFEAVAGTLTFEPGELSKTVTLTVMQSQLDELAEGFTLRFYEAQGAGFGDSTTAEVAITIPASGIVSNQAPLAADDAFILDEDTVLTGDLLADNGAGVDTDPDDDLLSVTLVNGAPLEPGAPITLVTGAVVVVEADGTFTYTPAADWSGLDTFIYTISDGAGGTAQATVSIETLAVNDAPEAADDAFTLDEDTVLEGSVLADNGAGADGDRDSAPDLLTVTLVDGPASGMLTLNEDGSFLYTPDPDFEGADRFTYRLSDGEGTDTATVDLTVAPVNDAPDAVDDVFVIDRNETLVGTVRADNGAGPDQDVDGDALTVAVVTQPASGLLMLNAGGSFIYTPDAGFSGTDSFVYSLTDEAGAVATATVTVTVEGPEVAYALGAVTNEGAEGSALTFTVTRTGDTDVAGSVSYAITGSGDNPAQADDFTNTVLSGTVTFAAGETEQAITVTLADDTAREADEEGFAVTLSAPQVNGGTGQVTTGSVSAVILDNDAPTVVGTAFADRLKGTNDADILDGGGGNDSIKARGGDDQVMGGAGADRLDGGKGNDVLLGGAGDDQLKDKKGANTFDGGAGIDNIRGGKGADIFIFKPGNGVDSIAKFGEGADRIDLTGFEGLTYDAVLDAATQVNKDAVVSLGTDTLILTKTDLADLSEADFLFA